MRNEAPDGAYTHPSGALAAKPAIGDLSLAGLRNIAVELGFPAYRGDQIGAWLYRSTIRSFGEMSNLPKALREALDERFRLDVMEVVVEAVATDDETRKVAFRLCDGDVVETVLMRYPVRADGTGAQRATVCVSAQVGCPVKCAFCATGLMGFTRNLSTAEIIGQALHFLRRSRVHPPVVRNVVFMGMGEPLMNYDATMGAVALLVDGAGLGVHRLTVSTSGWLPGMARLIDDRYAVRLAVSLHAPVDDLRTSLVPLNRRYPLPVLLDACWEYQGRTGRRVTFEYTLLDGVNDTPTLARDLVRLCRGRDVHVNLIPMNPVSSLPFDASRPEAVDKFHAILRGAGVICTIRQEMGREIRAACGQLRTEVQARSRVPDAAAP
jgi:23S rRNA (adenine2503-C2)-methyltransferase